MTRVNSWARYDAKRKGDPIRLMKERARKAVARSGREKRGKCTHCKAKGVTIWHHTDYTQPLEVEELCLKCHRAEHPRAMPHGGIA